MDVVKSLVQTFGVLGRSGDERSVLLGCPVHLARRPRLVIIRFTLRFSVQNERVNVCLFLKVVIINLLNTG
jgi:hypothetical protein